MNKPGRLRAALLAALPELASDPQKLCIYADRGRLCATGAPGAGWEYDYQITAFVQDFAGDMDALAHVVMAWVAVEQPDMLKNDEARKRGIRFEVELMNNELADVMLEIDVTEAVYVHANGYEHPPEPPADPSALWQ
jgi:P2 phage tail completion protein R (GpR)